MSNRLPTISVQRMIRVLEKLGFSLKRHRGGHAFFYHPDGHRTIVSIHPGDLPRGTVRRILKDIGMSEEDFREYL